MALYVCAPISTTFKVCMMLHSEVVAHFLYNHFIALLTLTLNFDLLISKLLTCHMGNLVVNFLHSRC